MVVHRWNALRRPVAYGSVMLASSAMNNVFVTYYIALFASRDRLTPAWFYTGQTIFMCVNMLRRSVWLC